MVEKILFQQIVRRILPCFKIILRDQAGAPKKSSILECIAFDK